mgnify:CR=1 FL=1
MWFSLFSGIFLRQKIQIFFLVKNYDSGPKFKFLRKFSIWLPTYIFCERFSTSKFGFWTKKSVFDKFSTKNLVQNYDFRLILRKLKIETTLNSDWWILKELFYSVLWFFIFRFWIWRIILKKVKSAHCVKDYPVCGSFCRSFNR